MKIRLNYSSLFGPYAALTPMSDWPKLGTKARIKSLDSVAI